MKVTIDTERCSGHARCWEVCPEVFSLDDEGYASIASEDVPWELESEVLVAIELCPERAITVT